MGDKGQEAGADTWEGPGKQSQLSLFPLNTTSLLRDQRRAGDWRERKAPHPMPISLGAKTPQVNAVIPDSTFYYPLASLSVRLAGSMSNICSQMHLVHAVYSASVGVMPPTLPPSTSHTIISHRSSQLLASPGLSPQQGSPLTSASDPCSVPISNLDGCCLQAECLPSLGWTRTPGSRTLPPTSPPLIKAPGFRRSLHPVPTLQR